MTYLTNTAPDVLEHKPFEAWKLSIIKKEMFDSFSKIEQLKYLAYFGLLAPTTHNVVPERFTFDEKKYTITLHADLQYVLPLSDPTGLQTLVSVGAVADNIKIAAKYYSLNVNYDFIAKYADIKPLKKDGKRYIAIMSITFTPSRKTITKNDEQLLHAILKRKVVRSEYNKTIPVDKKTIDELKQICRDYSLAKPIFTIDKAQIHTIAKLQEDADRTVYENRKFVMELSDWIQSNNDYKSVLGIRGHEFGFNTAFTEVVRKGFSHVAPLLPDHIAGMAKGGKYLIDSSPMVVAIFAKKDTLESYLECGMLYERLSLILWKNGYVHAILAAITEVEWVHDVFKATVSRDTKRLTVLMRAGKVKNAKDLCRPHSSRPTLKDVTL